MKLNVSYSYLLRIFNIKETMETRAIQIFFYTRVSVMLKNKFKKTWNENSDNALAPRFSTEIEGKLSWSY